MACVSPALRVMMVVAAGLSMFGWIGSDLLGTPRLVFAFARDGHLPAWLGRTHPRSHAPHIAILSYAFVAIALALTGTESARHGKLRGIGVAMAIGVASQVAMIALASRTEIAGLAAATLGASLLYALSTRSWTSSASIR